MGYFHMDGERLRWLLIGCFVVLLLLVKLLAWLVYCYLKKRK